MHNDGLEHAALKKMSQEDQSPESARPSEYESFLAKTFQIPEQFFLSLSNDNDWAFVIKLHALIEAAASHAIVAAFNDQRLTKVARRLNMGDLNTGKLALLKAWEVLDDGTANFIRGFSQIRNAVVHDVRNLDFNISKYLYTEDSQELQALRKRLCGCYAEETRIIRKDKPTIFKPHELLRENPRLFLIMGVTTVLFKCLKPQAPEVISVGFEDGLFLHHFKSKE